MDKVHTLYIAIKGDMERFGEAVNRAIGLGYMDPDDLYCSNYSPELKRYFNLRAKGAIEEVDKQLTAVEDCIKRFREGRPQAFEEDDEEEDKQ